MKSDRQDNQQSCFEIDPKKLQSILSRAAHNYWQRLREARNILSDLSCYITMDGADRAAYLLKNFNAFQKLALYLKPETEEGKNELIMFMNAILNYGGSILKNCLLETMSVSVSEGDATEKSLELACDDIYGAGTYFHYKEFNPSKSPLDLLKIISRDAYNQLGCDQQTKLRQSQTFREFVESGFNYDIFTNQIYDLNFNFKMIKEILIKALMDYIENNKFSSINLPFHMFGLSGPSGKNRANQMLRLLNILEADHPVDNAKMVILLKALCDSNCAHMIKFILNTIADSNGDRNIETGINALFGESAFVLFLMMEYQRDPDLYRVGFSKIFRELRHNRFDYSEDCLCDQYICERLFILLIKKEFNKLLSQDPVIKTDYVHFYRLLNGYGGFDAVRDLIRQPPNDTLLARLPSDLRRCGLAPIMSVEKRK